MVHYPKLLKKDNITFQQIFHSTIVNMRREKSYNKLIDVLKKNNLNCEEAYNKLKYYKKNQKINKKINYYNLEKLEYIYGLKNIEFLFLLEIEKIKYDNFYIYKYNNKYDIKRDLQYNKKTKYFIRNIDKNYYNFFKKFLRKDIIVLKKWRTIF